jgi:hypothetical protein
VSRADGLKYSSAKSLPPGKNCDGRVIQVKKDNKEDIGDVQEGKNAKQRPRRSAREQQGVTSTWMVEEKV